MAAVSDMIRAQVRDSGAAFFRMLGERVDMRWRRARYDEAAFSEVAAEVLNDYPPYVRCGIEDAFSLGFDDGVLCGQPDLEASFGQPPLTTYYQEKFRIDMLFWLDGIPAIHQHGFSGAFHVMYGSSLHTEWTFREDTRLGTRLLLGDLRLKGAELLEMGTTRKIVAGSSFIHATYHLDRPTVSIVLRTNTERSFFPQYSYLVPSIAYAALELSPTERRRIQLVKMMARLGDTRTIRNIVLSFLDKADAMGCLIMALNSYGALSSDDDATQVVAAVGRRYEKLAEALPPTLRKYDRVQRIGELRRSLSGPDLRFFLGVLLNLEDRVVIDELIRAKYPDSAAHEKVAGWIIDLIERKALEDVGEVDRVAIERYLMAPQMLPIEEVARLESLSDQWLVGPLFRRSS